MAHLKIKSWHLQTIWKPDGNREKKSIFEDGQAKFREWILKKCVVGMWNELVCLRMKTGVGLL
jgi:hypothetical protein